ncbi:MAG: bifunctional phosphoglucose/phosphomannose isomerase [Candidatus Eisenbacteria bacterium]|nr:bifunctional phosphoglucose/phosphomannose isomerase [Candidatus Eisenbacteria bacterium]
MILDAPIELRKMDPSGMLRLVSDMPQHIEKAMVISSSAPVGVSDSGFRHVAVAGMGGSAIAGDLVKMLMEERAGIPCVVVREYDSPLFVGQRTLLFCSSYSGNTEESLSLYEDARKRGARVICLGSGGELQRRAMVDGVPFLKMEEGLPPRAAIGYSFFMMYDVLRRMSILPEEPGEASEVVSLLRSKTQTYHEETPTSHNPAKKLAAELFNRFVVVYGSKLTSCVALRWKCQLNENSKTPAYVGSFPELDHNEIVGWRGLKTLGIPTEAIVLRDSSEHDRVGRRIDITLELMKADGVQTKEVWSEGRSLLARIFSLIYLGDFVSIYLAMLRGEDPTPVRRIDELKKRLSEETNT